MLSPDPYEKHLLAWGGEATEEGSEHKIRHVRRSSFQRVHSTSIGVTSGTRALCRK